MFGLGPTELIIIFAVFIIFFGAKRLPEIARGVGRGIVEFKQEVSSTNASISETTNPKITGGQHEVR